MMLTDISQGFTMALSTLCSKRSPDTDWDGAWRIHTASNTHKKKKKTPNSIVAPINSLCCRPRCQYEGSLEGIELCRAWRSSVSNSYFVSLPQQGRTHYRCHGPEEPKPKCHDDSRWIKVINHQKRQFADKRSYSFFLFFNNADLPSPAPHPFQNALLSFTLP